MYKCFFALSIFCISVKAQVKRGKLQIKTDDKISVHGFSYWKELKISSKDTSFNYPLHTKKPDIIPNLKKGTYTISVASVFNTKISKKISLKKDLTLVTFTGLPAVYHFANDTNFLSKKTKVNDTLYIIYSTTQDGVDNQKVALTKTKTDFIAIMYDGLTNHVFSYMHCNNDLYKYVISFEEDCKNYNAPKAETAPNKDVYTIELNKNISTFIIPENRNGLDKLKAILFAIQR